MINLDFLSNSKKEIFINMEKECFKGNVLDIGTDNYGIIYSLYKQFNDDIAVDYIEGQEKKVEIPKGTYDNCVLLFSLNNIWLKHKRKNFIKEIYDYLDEGGLLHIWDIDKSYKKIFNGKIRIVLPNRSIKEINILDMNIFKDISKDSTIKLINQYFEIIDLKVSDNIYYIKGIRKGRKENESIISRDKLEVHSQ